MSELPADEVLAVAEAWVWIPDDAERVESEDYLLVAYPEYFSDPTIVLRTASDRPAAELVAEVRDRVRTWGRPEFAWNIGHSTRPSDLEDVLIAAGGARQETLTVLAMPLEDTGGLEAYDVRPVLDAATLRDHAQVTMSVFGGSSQPEERIESEVRRMRDEYASGESLAVVAYLDDQPVGAAGVTIESGYARLWGGSVVESARGRGIYRRMLAARMAWAYEQGARAALVKGRVETSAPILLRLGFEDYGEERTYLLDA